MAGCATLKLPALPGLVDGQILTSGQVATDFSNVTVQVLAITPAGSVEPAPLMPCKYQVTDAKTQTQVLDLGTFTTDSSGSAKIRVKSGAIWVESVSSPAAAGFLNFEFLVKVGKKTTLLAPSVATSLQPTPVNTPSPTIRGSTGPLLTPMPTPSVTLGASIGN
jgi:hypothetical protein